MAELKPGYRPVKPDVQLPKQEEEILRFWDEQQIFQKTLAQSKERQAYSFYDGPPFATGLPHYGHLLAGILKDIVPRYWTMRGYHIPRRFGWDCHGLPVEYEINKSLQLDSRKQILAMGIDKYNAACRSIVQRYTGEWKETVRRVGRWVDMDNPYFTMDPSFMQSVWWVFRQLWDKGLIYSGHKVVPYSVGVSTPLSNFEANLNYKEVQDPSITVAFKAASSADLYFLAWTTTPWTLPSNLALAVGENIEYVQVKHQDKRYVLAEALCRQYFDEDVEIVQRYRGTELVDMRYEPLLPFFAAKAEEGAFRVILAEHVTTESGTGIVHMAPAFGEEDYVACQANGVPFINPVDDDGMFTDEVPDWAGLRVKDADKSIIARLKDEGSLFRQATYTHSYPFCWRSDTPLIYRAVSTWFVKVESLRDALLSANGDTNWVPEHLRDGRFGKWLENARDWAISRNRFWGTPLPIWQNRAGEIQCVGSIDELEQLSGVRVEDLHLEVVSEIEIPSPTGGEALKHIGSVLDCWFESGSMPYAQWGYPNENQEAFTAGFPADFIAEGLDQTRGWFYTLTVIGAALMGKSPFKNVIVNGLILAEDGKKMSKSLRNYPDPKHVLDEYGADALRLYLIDSPVVKAQELRFAEKGVRDIVRKILLRWWNAYSFYVNYANIDGFVPRGDGEDSPNILDQWILSRLHTLIERTNKEMEAYRLYNVVPALVQFIEELTNTYIRFNREHFWRSGMPEDKRLAFETLHTVLFTFAKVMAPFTPFLAESIYQNLRDNLGEEFAETRESVHLEDYPNADTSVERPALEAAVMRMTQLVLMGRNLRERMGVKAKIPLRAMRIIHRDPAVLEALKPLQSYFTEELNVREVHYESDEDRFIKVSAKANFPRLGPRLGKRMKAVAAAIQKLDVAQISELENGGSIEISLLNGADTVVETIERDDVEIRRAAREENGEGEWQLAAHQLISLELDPVVSDEQKREGLSREVVRRVQMARKNADLNLDDRIALQLECSGAVREAAEHHAAEIRAETLAIDLTFCENIASSTFSERADIDGAALGIGMTVMNVPKRTREYRNHHLDSTVWDDVVLRDNDVIITTAYKAGTTWMQQIVGNLIFRGQLPGPIHELSPWVDMRVPPREEKIAAMEAQTSRRFLKSHLPIDGIPYSAKCRYIYVGRDGRDVFMSLLNHYHRANDQWYELLNLTPGLVGDPMPRYSGDDHQIWRDWITKGWFSWERDGYPFWSLFEHVRSWWEYRDLPNVLFVHFANLKRDLSGEMRRIADFLQIDVDDGTLGKLVQKCTFNYMKSNAENLVPMAGKVFSGGAGSFINKGENGRWRDFLGPEELAQYDAAVARELTPECAHWLETGEFPRSQA